MTYKTPILTSIFQLLAVLCFLFAAIMALTALTAGAPAGLIAVGGVVLVAFALLGVAQVIAFVGEIAFNTRILVNQGAPKGTGQKSEPAQNSSASYRIPGID